MKTDELVAALARAGADAPVHSVSRYLLAATVAGLSGATMLMLAFLGVRGDLPHAVRLPMFWLKLGYAGVLDAAGMAAVVRLSRPDIDSRRSRRDPRPGAASMVRWCRACALKSWTVARRPA